MKKIKKNGRITSGKGGSGEEVSHFWYYSVDAIQRRKKRRENEGKERDEKMRENEKMRKMRREQTNRK